MKETPWHMKQGGAQTLFQNYQGRVDFYYADLIKNLKYMTDNQQLSLYPSAIRSSIFHLPPLLKETLYESAGFFSFMASSFLEWPLREEVLNTMLSVQVQILQE